jgi:hypothetical protein
MNVGGIPFSGSPNGFWVGRRADSGDLRLGRDRPFLVQVQVVLRETTGCEGSNLGTDPTDVVKLGIALIATIAALVLGLLIASAKSTYDT